MTSPLEPYPPTGRPSRPGWYSDPHIAGRDRWWNGDQWTIATAKTPRSMFGPGYGRMMRSGLNVTAKVSNWLARGAWLFLLGSGLLGSFVAGDVPGWLFGGILAMQAALSVAAIVAGVLALRGAPIQGGTGSAVRSITLACLALMLCGFVILRATILIHLTH